MTVSTEALEDGKTLVTISVEQAQENKMLREAAKQVGKQLRVPGFRPGSAPYSVVMKNAEPTVREAALNSDEMKKIVKDALNECDLNSSARITPDSVEWNPLTLSVIVGDD